MHVVTIPVTGYWVVCEEDSDYNEEFGSSDFQFDQADAYLHKKREERPDLTFRMIADIYA